MFVFCSLQKPTLPNSNSIWNARPYLNKFSRVAKDWEIQIADFAIWILQSNVNPKPDFTSEKSILRVDFN